MSAHKSHRFSWRKLATGVIVAAVAIAGAVVGAVPAVQAAEHGVGYDIGPGWIGSYTANGVNAYCLDFDAAPPVGFATDSGTIRGSGFPKYGGGTLTANEALQINYVISRYGGSSDPMTTSAVAMFVWGVASPVTYNSHGFTGDQWVITRAPSGARATILARLANMKAEAADEVAGGGVSSVTGSATTAINMINSVNGTVTVNTSPTNATGTLTLTGATFTATGLTTASVVNGSVLPITGIPVDGEEKYDITVNGAFTATVGGGYQENIRVHDTGSRQRLASMGRPGTSTINFNSAEFQTDPIGTVFEPIVETTVASKFVQSGDNFIDTLRATVANETDPATNPWRQSETTGAYTIITATGTLYGPFNYQPTPSALPPGGAPIAGTATVILDQGPGLYDSPAGVIAGEAGFYTWVWEIDYADQSAGALFVLPLDYYYADQFGLVAETHITPFGLNAVSSVVDSEVGLGGSVADTLTVSNDGSGSWLTDGGARVPVTYTGTAYFIPGTEAPVTAPTAPPGTVVLGTTSIVATGPGTYTSPALIAPEEPGFVTWVWQIETAAQPAAYQGMVKPWSDSFGLPAETTRIVPPEVTTVASASVVPGQPGFDTATVSGAVPAGSYLTFALYDQTGFDTPTCEVGNQVFETSAEPVLVPSAGVFESPRYDFPDAGTFFWVETLISGAGNVLHVGECGAALETTVAAFPTVTTAASAQVLLGQPATDIATIIGGVPVGSSLVFQAYRQAPDTSPVCEADNVVFDTSDRPIAVDSAGVYESAPVVFDAVGTYFWVETLLDPDGDVLHRGVCGEPLETTLVVKELAATGGGLGGAVYLLGGLIVVGAGAMVFARLWHPRSGRHARA